MLSTLTPAHLDYYLETAQREVAFCEHCQPTEAGQRVWRYGIPLKISELLYRLGVPASEQEFIAESLECNNCGALLHLEATVGLKPQSEREWEQNWRKWESQFANRFRDLHDFLAEYPSLGLQHRLGRQLFKALGDLPRAEIGLATLYCAQPVLNGKPKASREFNALTPSARTGCYQHAGQQAYLLTDSEAGAAHEILNTGEKICWLQKFQIARCKGVLDLSRMLADNATPFAAPLIYGLCYRGASKPSERMNNDETACLVARFLADCVRLHGFNGLRTKSAKHHANNLLLFNWPTDALEAEGEPYLFEVKSV